MNFPFAVSGALNGATVVTLYTPRDATNTLYITKITLSIVTHANAKFVAVQDSNSSPKVIAKHGDLTGAAGVPSTVTWDFGTKGIPLTLGKTLDIVSEASGVTGYVYVEGNDSSI